MQSLWSAATIPGPWPILARMAAFISSPFPYAAALQALYCPMRLTASDQPSLIGVDEKIGHDRP